MTISRYVRGIIPVLLLAGTASAQPPATPPSQPAKPPTATPAKPASPPATQAARPRPRPTGTHVVVRNASGTALADVTINVSGAAKSQATTGADGTTTLQLAAGSYRLRFEKEGFFALEREVTVRAGQASDVEVALNAAPPPPPPPAPPPPPPAPAPPPPKAVVAAGPPVSMSIPGFIDKNFIGGRDPLKESVLACTPDATTRLLQLREPISDHKHVDLDELIYVVAGEGAIKIGDQSNVVGPGSLSVIPRGMSHAIERRGRNPLILLSQLAGAPCPPGISALTSTK